MKRIIHISMFEQTGFEDRCETVLGIRVTQNKQVCQDVRKLRGKHQRKLRTSMLCAFSRISMCFTEAGVPYQRRPLSQHTMNQALRPRMLKRKRIQAVLNACFVFQGKASSKIGWNVLIKQKN